jgi:Ca2+-binding RTX toxin-like protein
MRDFALGMARRVAVLHVICGLAVPGCIIPGPDHGAVGGPWAADPCNARKPTVFDDDGDHVFIGTDGPDVIFGTPGADEIWGNGGDDIVCAREGEDSVHGGDGDDYIDGGGDNDELSGGPGKDLIHGRSGGDQIHGGPGADELFGDLLDDRIHGDEGADLLVGGHGTDLLDGGPDDDWLRGDTNADDFIGGGGDDVVSFATATPPGQPQGSEGSPNPIDGVTVDFAGKKASGDGFAETMKGFSKVVGSPFADRFDAIGPRKVLPGYGSDLCDGAPCAGSGPAPAGQVFVYLTNHPRDLGLVVLGTTGDDVLQIEAVGHKLRVTAENGAPLANGDGCDHPEGQPSVVDCPIGIRTLRYILGWGDTGNDTIQMRGDMPRDITVHLDGGEGDDTLVGGAEEDVLFTGRMGHDVLRGHGGDDALISESYDWHKGLAGVDYPGKGDELDGGGGDDQLVVDYLCAGHWFRGGKGTDVAGFARSGSRPIKAQLGGGVDRDAKKPFHGRAFNDLCTGDWETYATYLDGHLEILEGADGSDELHGNARNNVLWGRQGDDQLFGHGGDDIVEGLSGDDDLYGGLGHDVLRGGKGYDALHAGDGQDDDELSCGEGGGKMASKDGSDPPPTDCEGVAQAVPVDDNEPGGACLGTGACTECMAQSCSAPTAACIGPGWLSGDFGGPCGAFLACFCECTGDQATCSQACAQLSGPECSSCLAGEYTTCIQTSCSAVCQ